MSHDLFVSNRSGSLNRSLFLCVIDRWRSKCTPSLVPLSASRFVDKNPRSSIHPVSVHPCRGSPTRIFLLPLSLSFALFIPLLSSFYLASSFEQMARIHCAHRTDACTRTDPHHRTEAPTISYEIATYIYVCIIRSALFANSPSGQTSPLIAIIDSLNRVRGSDGHLLLEPAVNMLITRPLGQLTSARPRIWYSSSSSSSSSRNRLNWPILFLINCPFLLSSNYSDSLLVVLMSGKVTKFVDTLLG